MSRLIAFWSPSRAGASTLLLNTAAALGARHIQLVAADLNLTTPSLALYADLLPHQAPLESCMSKLLPALNGGRLTGDELSRRLLPGPGFMVFPGMLDVISGSRLTEGQIKQVLRMLAGRFDLILADVTAPMDSIGCLPVLEMADVICLVVGPDLSSRFHTRRYTLPVIGMGWQGKTLVILNRCEGAKEAQVSEELGIPVSIGIPEWKAMDSLIEAGEIAYDVRTVLPAAARFRTAVERLAALVAKGG